MTAGPDRVELRGAGPARALAAAAPLVALALVAFGAWSSGLRSGPDDPAPPAVMAVLTLALGAAVSWRAATQSAVVGPDGLRCRNLSSTFEVDRDRVEALVVRHRAGLVTVDVVVRHLRRHHRLGAATRFTGPQAEAVLGELAAHPWAGPRLIGVDGGPSIGGP